MGETLYSKNTDIGRVYEWNGDEFVSVTTAIKNGIAKPGLVNWAAKQVANIAVRDADTVHADSAEDHIRNIISAFEGIRGAASETGNIVHGLCDRLAKGEEVNDDEIDEASKPFIVAYRQFLADWSPKYIESEAFVASKKYGYAGTLDAIIEIDGKAYLMDIKTGKSIYPEVGLQLAAYARADFIGSRGGSENKLPDIHPTRGLVLHLRPNKYALYPVRMDDEVFDAFLAALDVHNYETHLKHYIVGPKMVKEEPENGEGVEIGK